jgi:membrane associated rhomboid family serine protease
MIPYRDDNPLFRTPVATLGLILANVVVWLVVQRAGDPTAVVASVCELGLIPGELLHRVPRGALIELGNGAVCLLGTGSSWYTPLTSMFLHGGWEHLIGNMWFLWLFGNNVEDSMGRAKYLAFYLLCGIGAALLQTAVQPDSLLPMVGASGAISGIMGAYVILYPRIRVHMWTLIVVIPWTFTLPAFFMIGYWFLLQLLGGLMSAANAGGVAFWAHVGGFVTGVVLLFPFRDPGLVAQHRRLAAWA